MKKIIFVLGFLLMMNFVSAVDVAYVVINDYNIKTEFIDALDRLSLTRDIVHSSDVSTYDFSGCKLILLDDEYFPNWAEIPVNEVPALMVNGRNIADWGWTRRVTIVSQDQPIHVVLNTSHEIKGTLGFEVPVYTATAPDIYHLDKDDIYDGLELIAGNTYDNDDAVIAIAHNGTDLTRGVLTTEINANGVFFGIKETNYWTDETRELFDNSLMWLLGDATFSMNLKTGQNLISFPLIINSTPTEMKNDNANIISIKEYNNNNFIDAVTLENNKGYFIEASNDFTLTITGDEPENPQSVVLNQGMNLIGITSLLNINLNNLPGEIIEVAKRGEAGVYEVATKYGSVWFNSFELEPGKGYWFKTNQEVNWNYSP